MQATTAALNRFAQHCEQHLSSTVFVSEGFEYDVSN